MASTSKAPGGTDWLKTQAKRVSEGGELPVSEQQAAAVAIEAWLQRHGVEYAPPVEIPMALIDERRSRANQARKDPIVPESVDRFTTAMKAGANFPPIVVYPSSGKLIIIDGNNRQAAASRAALQTILGIVVADDTPGELIQLLTVEANAHHGVTPELQWRLRQAFHLVSMGFTDQQAADACGVTTAQIGTARRIQEADAKARTLKIDGFTNLPATSRGVLAALRDDAVFSRASRLALSCNMTIDEIRDMLRQVKTASSEKSRLAALEALAEERGYTTASKKILGRPPGRTASSKALLVSGVGMVLRCDEQQLAKAIVTKHDRDVIRSRLRALEEKLLALQVALDTVDVEDE